LVPVWPALALLSGVECCSSFVGTLVAAGPLGAALLKVTRARSVQLAGLVSAFVALGCQKIKLLFIKPASKQVNLQAVEVPTDKLVKFTC